MRGVGSEVSPETQEQEVRALAARHGDALVAGPASQLGMATVVMTTRIDRPPADVFAVLADVSKNTAWSKTSISGRLTSPPPVGLGSTAREVSRFMGRRIEVDSTIVAFVSDRTFSFVTSTGPFPFRGSFTTEPAGAGTVLTSEFVAEPTGLLRIGDGLFGALIRRKFEADLSNLKRLLESGEL